MSTTTRYTVVPPWTLSRTYWPFRVEVADLLDTRSGRTYVDGAQRVVDERTNKPAKRGKGGTVPFKGETAWSDAERLAQDLMFAERYAR